MYTMHLSTRQALHVTIRGIADLFRALRRDFRTYVRTINRSYSTKNYLWKDETDQDRRD